MQCFTTGYPFVIHWWNYTFLKTGQNIVSPVSTGETDEKVPALPFTYQLLFLCPPKKQRLVSAIPLIFFIVTISLTIAGKVIGYKKDDFLFCFFVSFVERSKGIGDRVSCESYFYDEKFTCIGFHNFLQPADDVKILFVHLTGNKANY